MKYKFTLGVLNSPKNFSLIGVTVPEIRLTTLVRAQARRAQPPRGVKKAKISNFWKIYFFSPRGPNSLILTKITVKTHQKSFFGRCSLKTLCRVKLKTLRKNPTPTLPLEQFQPTWRVTYKSGFSRPHHSFKSHIPLFLYSLFYRAV